MVNINENNYLNILFPCNLFSNTNYRTGISINQYPHIHHSLLVQVKFITYICSSGLFLPAVVKKDNLQSGLFTSLEFFRLLYQIPCSHIISKKMKINLPQDFFDTPPD